MLGKLIRLFQDENIFMRRQYLCFAMLPFIAKKKRIFDNISGGLTVEIYLAKQSDSCWIFCPVANIFTVLYPKFFSNCLMGAR